MNACLIVESLEDRIAPASTFTFTDTDGDFVTISSSAGDLANAGITLAAMNANSGIMGSQQLTKLDISDAQFAGTNLTITAKPQVIGGFLLGDGFVNVGWIEAGTNNLGMVKIDGDLGEIDAGNNTGIAIKKLQVQSIGKYGTTTGGNAGLESMIGGGVDSFAVKGDVVAAYLNIGGSVKTLDIKGSLIGGANAQEGYIASNGGNSAKIGGSVVGGAGANAGALTGSFKTITVGGDLIGSSGETSGYLSGPDKVIINGGIKGGSGMGSGAILGAISVSVKLNVEGGSAFGAGKIIVGTNGSVKIGGNLVGGTFDYAGSVTATENANISIGGSIIGGTDIFTGTIEVTSAKKIAVGGSIYGASSFFSTSAGGIYADKTLGDVSIKGSVFGENGRAFIIAQGVMNSSALAIGKVTIGGNVDGLDILAGYDPDFMTGDFVATNGDASIGAVNVKGNWSASNLVAGVETNNVNTGFRTNDTTLINGHDPAIIAKIASLAIGGQAMGFAESAYFNGFVAEKVPTKFKVGKKTYTFVNANDVLGIGSTYNSNEGLNFLAYNVTTT